MPLVDCDPVDPAEDYPLRLDLANRVQAAAEIADYCKRTGATLEPQTESYRKVGIEFIKAKVAAGRGWLPLPDGRDVHGSEQHLPPLPKIEPPIAPEPTVEPANAPPQPQKKGAETFAEAAAVYLRTELAEDVKAATVEEYRRKICFPAQGHAIAQHQPGHGRRLP